jgi:hypothetical protein
MAFDKPDKDALFRKQPKRCYLFPKTLGAAVDWSAQAVFAKNGFSNSDVIYRWKDIVGAELSGYCTPVKMTSPNGRQGEGRLYLKVKSGAYAMQVQYQEAVILERLATFYGYRVASRIVILQ